MRKSYQLLEGTKVCCLEFILFIIFSLFAFPRMLSLSFHDQDSAFCHPILNESPVLIRSKLKKSFSLLSLFLCPKLSPAYFRSLGLCPWAQFPPINPSPPYRLCYLLLHEVPSTWCAYCGPYHCHTCLSFLSHLTRDFKWLYCLLLSGPQSSCTAPFLLVPQGSMRIPKVLAKMNLVFSSCASQCCALTMQICITIPLPLMSLSTDRLVSSKSHLLVRNFTTKHTLYNIWILVHHFSIGWINLL